jgi:acyl-CoA ligase (AMP-forming) (exosortase A-associated)
MVMGMRVLLPDLVSVMASARPEAPALVDRHATLTYADLAREMATVASGLRRSGVEPGDRVAVYCEKRVEVVAAIFGSSAAGAVFVPINPLLRARQVAHILNDSQARVLVTTPERLATLREELAGCRSLELVTVVGGSADAAGYRVVGWADLPADDPLAAPGVVDVDMAAILYTSGSTGAPKGVVLSHRNLIAGAESVATYLGNQPDDVILAALPFSFDAGLSQLTTGLYAGARVVLMNYLGPRDVIRLCAAHGVTGLTCVPPLWIQLAEQSWPAEATRSLRYFANTGGRMPKTTLDRLRGIFPQAAPYLMYGLTEAFRSTYLDPAEVDRRPDSIGKAIPNAEILVVRPDGSPCDPGEEGELVHRGALVSMGYWNDPERTSARFRPAPGRPAGLPGHELAVWSGDRVIRDEDGFLYFVGRSDEMIKTSGYRVSPSEVEEVAYRTGLVRDAVALGREDSRLGQHIVLVVTTPDGSAPLDPERLLVTLREQLPRYMLPHHVVVRDRLPQSPNGKFDRVRLREELA